jgi:arylsulfatase
VLDAAGLPEPTFVHGVQQMPLHGVSMASSFDDAAGAERRETQYFEMFCNRGIYHKGWTAVTRHSTPWVMTENPPLEDDVWELYAPDDLDAGPRPRREQPERLAELQRLFLIEATKYNVLPLDDRRAERFNPDLAGRPQLIRGTRQLLFGGMGRLSENSVVVVKNKSHAVTAQIAVPDGGAEGVIVRPGRRLRRLEPLPQGWPAGLLLQPLRPAAFKVHGETAVAPGEHQVRMEFAYDGGGLGKGGTATLYLDGASVGEGRIDATVPMMFSATRPPTSAPTAARPSATTSTCARAASRGACAGWRSTSATTRRTPTTSSPPRSA